MDTPEEKKTVWEQLWRGLKASLDEAALFGGGAIGAYLINYFQNRGQQQKVRALEKAQKLHAEGKHEEAQQLVVQSQLFGIGYQDEMGMLCAIAYFVQFCVDAGEEVRIGPFLDALDGLDEETKERLERSFAVIDSVEERGQILVRLSGMPGDLATSIPQVCRISRIDLDPKNHPATVLVDEIGGAINHAFGGYTAKLEAERQRLRDRRAARAARRP